MYHVRWYQGDVTWLEGLWRWSHEPQIWLKVIYHITWAPNTTESDISLKHQGLWRWYITSREPQTWLKVIHHTSHKYNWKWYIMWASNMTKSDTSHEPQNTTESDISLEPQGLWRWYITSCKPSNMTKSDISCEPQGLWRWYITWASKALKVTSQDEPNISMVYVIHYRTGSEKGEGGDTLWFMDHRLWYNTSLLQY